jgi:hypothetical protein
MFQRTGLNRTLNIKLNFMRIEWIEKLMTEAEALIVNNQVENGLELLNSLLYDEPGYGSLHNHIGWAYVLHG